ncbi:MAG: nucleoside-diphosphate kinase [Candidatus Anstonellales archaeon]
MARERTFFMIKPEVASDDEKVREIRKMITDAGFEIIAEKNTKIKKTIAEKHYAIHKGKPFYDGLIEYITSGRVVMFVLEKENGIADLRKLVGATDPKKAEPGTIRARFGVDVGHNAVHASDSPATAEFEIGLHFPKIKPKVE